MKNVLVLDSFKKKEVEGLCNNIWRNTLCCQQQSMNCTINHSIFLPPANTLSFIFQSFLSNGGGPELFGLVRNPALLDATMAFIWIRLWFSFRFNNVFHLDSTMAFIRMRLWHLFGFDYGFHFDSTMVFIWIRQWLSLGCDYGFYLASTMVFISIQQWFSFGFDYGFH